MSSVTSNLTPFDRQWVEKEVERNLRQQARAYKTNTAGSPAAVARHLRNLADKLDAVDEG